MLKPLSLDNKLEYKAVYKYTRSTSSQRFTVIQKAWGNRPPLLKLSKLDRERGWDNLRRLGVPEGAWFVTLHSRESGYWKARDPGMHPGDNQSHRNGDIHTYIPAIRAIVERGGWCIRVGDATMKPLPQMDKVIDYAHLDIKSDWMDVFLLASCRFLLGGSGVFSVCTAFGVPNINTNLAPLGGVLWFGFNDISLPKLVWSNTENRLLTFKETLDSPVGNFIRSHLFSEANVRLVDNSPEEIRDVAMEMLDRIEGKTVYTAKDELLQERFKSLFRPCHLTYGGGSRVGRDFLRKHVNLLFDEIDQNEKK